MYIFLYRILNTLDVIYYTVQLCTEDIYIVDKWCKMTYIGNYFRLAVLL